MLNSGDRVKRDNQAMSGRRIDTLEKLPTELEAWQSKRKAEAGGVAIYNFKREAQQTPNLPWF
jgi:hypothetical protein